jgi:hypothetical protein
MQYLAKLRNPETGELYGFRYFNENQWREAKDYVDKHPSGLIIDLLGDRAKTAYSHGY